MLELGDISKAEHEKIGLFISDLNLEKVFFVGSRMKNAFLNCKKSYWYDNKKDLEIELKNIVIKESIVLIKGSRNLKLESLLTVIEKISI
jgi:UDP-N-acetylmuramoyl-tripeptide--D-alanyl-D-alanine ligase